MELVKKTQNGHTMELVGGLDIGNGYTKGGIYNTADGRITEIDMPSCVSIISHPQNMKPEDEELDNVIMNLYDQLDIVVGSHMVPETRRLYVGSRSVNSSTRPVEFNVASHLSKANDPLSVMLLLSCIAGKAMKDVWTQDHALPNDVVSVDTTVALALPIREYINHAKAYRMSLMQQPHMVTIHNFSRDVVFRITFRNVVIIAEGVAAQYGIVDKGPKFMGAMLQYARKAMMDVYGPECQSNMLFKVQPQDVLDSTNTVGIDIGEGTVNYAVFRNGDFAVDVSSNLQIGYGSVLANALDELQDAGYPFNTRKELTEYLAIKPSLMQKEKYDRVKDIVANHITSLVESIAVDFSTTMSKAGAIVEVVYVYGGGATPIQTELYCKLIDTMRVNQQDSVLLLYLDSSWSRNLNREGLLGIAKTRYENTKAQAQVAQSQKPAATQARQ